MDGNTWAVASSSADGLRLAVGSGVRGYFYTDGGILYTGTADKSNGSIKWTYSVTGQNFMALAPSSDGLKLAAAMGYFGLYTSTDAGVSWTKTSAPDQTTPLHFHVDAGDCNIQFHWQALASSSDGSKLVAATGYNDRMCGSYGTIYTSANRGVTWSPVVSPPWPSGRTELFTCADFLSITSSSDGSKIAAVAGTDNQKSPRGIYTSADSGRTWVKTSALALDWRDITSSSDGSKLVAVTASGGIYISTNRGVAWSLSSAPSPKNWGSIASSSDGSRLAASSCGDGIYTSINGGASWTKTSAPASDCVLTQSWGSIASSSDGTKLVFVGHGGVYNSADGGVSWTRN